MELQHSRKPPGFNHETTISPASFPSWFRCRLYVWTRNRGFPSAWRPNSNLPLLTLWGTGLEFSDGCVETWSSRTDISFHWWSPMLCRGNLTRSPRNSLPPRGGSLGPLQPESRRLCRLIPVTDTQRYFRRSSPGRSALPQLGTLQYSQRVLGSVV